MIISLIVMVISGLLALMSGLLGTIPWELPAYIINPIEENMSKVMLVNVFFPIKDVIICTVLIYKFWISYLIVKIIIGIISLVRGGGNIEV